MHNQEDSVENFLVQMQEKYRPECNICNVNLTNNELNIFYEKLQNKMIDILIAEKFEEKYTVHSAKSVLNDQSMFDMIMTFTKLHKGVYKIFLFNKIDNFSCEIKFDDNKIYLYEFDGSRTLAD